MVRLHHPNALRTALECPLIPRAFVIGITMLLSACVSAARFDSVPPGLHAEAQPLGIRGLRFYPENFVDCLGSAGRQATWSTPPMAPTAELSSDRLDMLAISGGGDGGAFAVGVLIGWSQMGSRPTFGVVTGVSAGALIAPFAFLGPKYDSVLGEVTLSTHPGKFFRKQGLLSGLLGESFASSEPLRDLINTYITNEVLAETAVAYRNGRDLYIMTTDLDAGTPAIWDMGAIAASGAAGALDLFRKVVLASASIPGLASPVMIDVTAGGRRFRELHVDGVVSHQVFLCTRQGMSARPARFLRPLHDARAFVIMNTSLQMQSYATPRRALKIGSRALETITEAEAKNDIDVLSAALRRDGIEFQLAYIDSDFQFPHPRDFDSSYTRALFSYGLRFGSAEHRWHRAAPPANADGSMAARLQP